VSALQQVIDQLSTVRDVLDQARSASLGAVEVASDAAERAAALGAVGLTQDLAIVAESGRQLAELVSRAAGTAVKVIAMAEAIRDGTGVGRADAGRGDRPDAPGSAAPGADQGTDPAGAGRGGHHADADPDLATRDHAGPPADGGHADQAAAGQRRTGHHPSDDSDRPDGRAMARDGSQGN
jgi:hypothetical protein